MLNILFCDNGFSSNEVDDMYLKEYQTAKAANFQTFLISFEALKEGNWRAALKKIRPPMTQQVVIYRGWMLKPHEYQQFYKALLQRNLQLINTPKQYQFCHYLPDSYSTIRDFTPKTTFKKLEGAFDIADFRIELEIFGKQPIIVKDFVKSQKHFWKEACFIPDASNFQEVEKVVQYFLELQGDDLNEGLVFREFIELEELTTHSKSGMPLTKEFRLFVKDRKIIGQYNYWDEGDYTNTVVDLTPFQPVIAEVKSRFFTMDIAKTVKENWMIVELGDGQVAGLPDNADIRAFYDALRSGF